MFRIILSVIFILILIYCKKNLLVNYYGGRDYKPVKISLWAILLTIFLILLPITGIVLFSFYIVMIIMLLSDGTFIWKEESIINKVIEFLNKTY